MPTVAQLTIYIKKHLSLYWTIPAALLATCILAYGLLIPWLGYYHDDWHFIYYDSIRGTQGLIDMFNYDGHPLAVLVYILSFKLVGLSPTTWHIYALIWRWLAVTMFWRLLDLIWPRQKRFTFSAALFFAIYPLFALQVLPISYFEVWIGFFLFFLSLYWTVRAILEPEYFWLFVGYAIAAKFGQMLTSEYTWGMELMRPIIIWVVLSLKSPLKERAIKTAAISLPFMAIFLSFGVWRSIFFQAGRKEIAFQSGMLTDPLSALINWIRYAIPDFGLVLITSWYKIFDPSYMDLNNRLNFFLAILIIVCTIGFFLILNRLTQANPDNTTTTNYVWQSILIGIAGFLFGLIPAYASGYIVFLSAPPGNARFALGAIPGAALIITGLLELIIRSARTRNIMIAILIGLSIGWHVRYTNEFRDIWKYQVSFYRQLTWRVPDLKPGTALIPINKFFPSISYPSAILAVSGDYPTAMALNTIYDGKPDNSGKIPYWFFLTYKPGEENSLAMDGEHLDSQFSAKPDQTLYFSFNPQEGQCLRLYAPKKDDPSQYNENTQPDSLTGVDLNSSNDFRWLNNIIGPEETDNWCYLYEKADLASQKEDWQAVQALWDTAQKKGLSTSEGREYIPFITAAAKSNNWPQALTLTRNANKITQHGANVYCQLWRELANTTPDSSEKDPAIKKLREQLNCQ